MHHLCSHKNPPLSCRQLYTAFVFIDIVFFISGLIHVRGEYMMVSRLSLGAFQSFLLQGLVVSVETIVSNLVNLLNLASPQKADADCWVRLGVLVILVVPALHGGCGVPGGFL